MKKRLCLILFQYSYRLLFLKVLLLDVSIPLTEEDYNILEDTKNSNRIIIGNKLDITDNKSYDKADIYISAKTVPMQNEEKTMSNTFSV